MSDDALINRTMRASASPGTTSDTGLLVNSEKRENIALVVLRRRLASGLSLSLIYLFLIIMTIFALFPIYYVVQASLAGGQNLYTTDLHILPANPTLDNYVYAFTQEPLLGWLANSFFVCGLATLIGLVFSMTGAYALSRFRFAGRELSLNLLLALQAFPSLLAITAYYYLLQYLGLLDNAPLLGLAFVYASQSIVMACWNIKGYYDTLPVELEQAAMIDGASHTQAFLRITLPLAAPALAASALFIFLVGWNEFALANFVLNSNDTGSNLTYLLGLYRLQSDFRTPWGYFAATSVVITTPVMIVFLYAQRFFRSGLTIGSVKG